MATMFKGLSSLSGGGVGSSSNGGGRSSQNFLPSTPRGGSSGGGGTDGVLPRRLARRGVAPSSAKQAVPLPPAVEPHGGALTARPPPTQSSAAAGAFQRRGIVSRESDSPRALPVSMLPPTSRSTASHKLGAAAGLGSCESPRAAVEPAPPADGSSGRMNPGQAVHFYESKLSKYERREIMEYDEVFFVGAQAAKIAAPVPDSPNFGFDDERGDYVVVPGDHVAFRYEVMSELGKGSFGQVLRAHDHKKGTQCALKIIRNKKRFHQQATVEIRILDHLRCRDPDEKSCTVRMLNYFKFRNHTIITFDIHSINLYELTKLNNYQPFAPALIKRFAAQLLVALGFMWQEHVVHCDLKPENILLRYENKTSIKIIDFGSSCFESERVYTYIQSRFYRAPEIMLGVPYTRKIDMWSLGCVICEMQIGYPIFPGENESDQLACVMEVLGVPPARFVERAPRRAEYFEGNGAPKITPNSRNKVRKPGTKDLARVLKSEDTVFLDFIRCFLQWDPAERMTPHEAMHHPWVGECFKHDPAASASAAVTTASAPTKPTPPVAPPTSAPSSSRKSNPTSSSHRQLPTI